MQNSNLPLRTWAFAAYLLTTSPKSVSSIKLANDLGITQKTAWFLAHRLRRGWEEKPRRMTGPVEIDEAYIGGIRKYMHADKRYGYGRGGYGKRPIAGDRDRDTGRIQIEILPHLGFTNHTIHGFLDRHVKYGAIIYHDQDSAFNSVRFTHDSVNHSQGEYVRDDVSTNSIESFWTIVKRSYRGIHHFWSYKHAPRYIAGLQGRFNNRHLDTIVHMELLFRQSDGRDLPYRNLIGRTYQPRLPGGW